MDNPHVKAKVSVGTQNPAKIKAVEIGFAKVWPEKAWEITGCSVNSGISNQPMSDKETILGAKNRAYQALHNAPSEYGVGLEGGLQEIEGQWFDCGWVVVINRDGVMGIGSTARIITPPKMMEKINQGLELGHVVDQTFGTLNAKEGDGHFGLMTNGVITRTAGYRDGVIMALVRFLHQELF